MKKLAALPGHPGDAVGKLVVVAGYSRLDDGPLGGIEVVGNGVGHPSVGPQKSCKHSGPIYSMI